MALNEMGEEVVVTPPAPKPGADGAGSGAKPGEQVIDFDKELADLESNGGAAPAVPTPAPRGKTPDEERKQAEFSLKSTAKRLRELGGDPSSAIADGGSTDAPAPAAPIDTSRFVTKDDLAIQEARKIAQSEGEFKVIMWHVKNRGLSVEDSHILANKGRFKKTLAEITRAGSATPSQPGGGAGQPAISKGDDAPDLDPDTKQKVIQAGQKWNPDTKSWEGKLFRLRWTGSGWVNERIPQKK